MLKYNTQELFQRHQSASTPEVLQRTVVCLHNIRSGYNVGAVFRNADAFGIREIFLSGFTPTPPSSEISKTAIGAESNVSWKAYENWEDCYVNDGTISPPPPDVPSNVNNLNQISPNFVANWKVSYIPWILLGIIFIRKI